MTGFDVAVIALTGVLVVLGLLKGLVRVLIGLAAGIATRAVAERTGFEVLEHLLDGCGIDGCRVFGKENGQGFAVFTAHHVELSPLEDPP